MKYWLMACKRTVSWSELSISGRIQFENTKMPKVLIWRLDEVMVRTSIFYHVYSSTGSPHGCVLFTLLFLQWRLDWGSLQCCATQTHYRSYRSSIDPATTPALVSLVIISLFQTMKWTVVQLQIILSVCAMTYTHSETKEELSLKSFCLCTHFHRIHSYT